MINKRKEFLNKKFLEWQTALGIPQTQKAFATQLLKMPPTTYSNFYNSDTKPRGIYLQRMVDLWGENEVYEAFDLSPEEIVDPLEGLPPKLRDVAKEVRATIAQQGISLDSPEAESLVQESLIKHGFNVKAPDKPLPSK